MNILITGGNGFLGQKLARQLLRDGITLSNGAQQTVQSLLLCDVQTAPHPIADSRITTQLADISDVAVVKSLISQDINVIYHLAAVVSGQAEQEFGLGMRINLDGTRNLLDASREAQNKPLFIFASSAAVYGGDMPDILIDSTLPNPQSSYGTQKLMGELMVNDYSRKGFIDGRSLRLPTVSVRPGKPNAAASSFASGIIREPLNGQSCTCPVKLETPVWLTSPRTVVDNIVHAAGVQSEKLGLSRSIPLPGMTTTVRHMLDALKSVAGANVRGLVTCVPEPDIEKIVYGWPGKFITEKADSLGFIHDTSFAEIIQQYINDDLEEKA